MIRFAVLGVLALLGGGSGCSEERPRAEPNVTGRVHPIGILDEDSENFHGRELARRNYDFALCTNCHGDDFGGGAADAACTSCHKAGPTACSTCHRDDNESPTHLAHRAASVDCATCHPVPESWDAPGHLDAARPADVTLAGFAAGQCTTSCHGSAMPRWTDSVTGSCTACHGAPPPGHAQPITLAQCATCHPTSAPHIDGIVQVGTTNGCDGCHGRNGDAAPPRDLSGNELTTALGVGAHQAHVVGPSRLRGPVACAQCHQVPAATTSPGHIDTVGPAEVTASLGWNRAAATCSSAWCHGSAQPVWTQTGGAACGSCHAVPPATPAHASATSLSTCASCHPRVVDSFGNFVFENGVTQHLDGDVDVN